MKQHCDTKIQFCISERSCCLFGSCSRDLLYQMSDTGSCEPLNFISVVGVQIPTGWSIFMQLQKDYGALNVTLVCLCFFLLGFGALPLVSLGQMYYNFYTIYLTTKHRPNMNLDVILFMVSELCPFIN